MNTKNVFTNTHSASDFVYDMAAWVRKQQAASMQATGRELLGVYLGEKQILAVRMAGIPVRVFDKQWSFCGLPVIPVIKEDFLDVRMLLE